MRLLARVLESKEVVRKKCLKHGIKVTTTQTPFAVHSFCINVPLWEWSKLIKFGWSTLPLFLMEWLECKMRPILYRMRKTVKFLYCLFQIMALRFDSVVNSIVIQKYIGSLATCLKFCMTWITFMEVYVTEELNRPSPLQRSCKHFCISDILDQFDPFLIYPMEPGPHINTISLYCSLK